MTDVELCEKPRITHDDVVSKFQEIHKKYTHQRGYMISTLDDDISKQFIDGHPEIVWSEVYNFYASPNVKILSTTVYVTVFGQRTPIILERPNKQDHRFEYEEYFGFGGHNAGFTKYRIIARMPGSYNKELDLHSLLRADNAEITETYATDVLLFLVLGGYIKYWNGYYDMNRWFVDNNIMSPLCEDKTGGDFLTHFIMNKCEIVVPSDENKDNIDS
jgi:hypothetical protein